MVDCFYNILNNEIDQCIPSSTIRIRPRDKPGMTSEVRALLNKARRLNRVAKITARPEDKTRHSLVGLRQKKLAALQEQFILKNFVLNLMTETI